MLCISICFEISYTAPTAETPLTRTMKETFFYFSLKRAATLCLALAAVCTTALTLNSCGGGGEEETRGTITYNQFLNGSKGLYLQAGSGMILRCEPDLVNSSSQSWGYFYPVEQGIGAIPGPEYQAAFAGLAGHRDDNTPMQGSVTIFVGYAGHSYSKETGFTGFLGFPSNVDPQLQLAGPLKVTLNFDTRTWKTMIPNGSVLSMNIAGIETHVFSDDGSNTSSNGFIIEQEREGSFDVMEF